MQRTKNEEQRAGSLRLRAVREVTDLPAPRVILDPPPLSPSLSPSFGCLGSWLLYLSVCAHVRGICVLPTGGATGNRATGVLAPRQSGLVLSINLIHCDNE